jgi:alkanesulfonate monooxygenase SsuD/methylene tetrahydromethanopterin reductase-like flavin-dependent oxidoreductase (luciferase family)
MEIGIGLPATIPGVEGGTVLEWARKADARGFSSLGVIDRLVYANYEPLIALAAAVAVTERIRLTTAILIAPLRSNTALFAKQAASIDRLSGGRLVLGLAVGGREDDFTASGLSMKMRGKAMDEQLEELKRVWAGEQRGFAGGIGPSPARQGGPELIIGGQVEAAFRRAAQHGSGWIMGGGTPDDFAKGLASVTQAWKAAGRTDKPRNLALCYFSLGPDARKNADGYLRDYYAFAGPYVDMIAQGAAVSEEMVRSYAGGFEAAGCDELICFPCSPDPGQVDLLAAAVAQYLRPGGRSA